jgi:hypothetical protein
MYNPTKAMAWLYSNPHAAALFVRRVLQAALDKEPKADVIHTEVNVLLYETPQAQPTVLVTVDIPEEDTARALLSFLRRPSGSFARTNTRTGGDCITGSLDGDVWVKVLLLDDGLLHVVVEPRAVIVM